jgi:hypothetical protein
MCVWIKTERRHGFAWVGEWVGDRVRVITKLFPIRTGLGGGGAIVQGLPRSRSSIAIRQMR